MTLGCLSKPGAELTIPKTLNQALIAVQIAELALEAGEDRQSRQARRLVAFLFGDLCAHLAERIGQGAVWVDGNVPRDVGAVTAHPYPGEGQDEPGWGLHRFRQNEPQLFQLRFDIHCLHPSPSLGKNSSRSNAWYGSSGALGLMFPKYLMPSFSITRSEARLCASAPAMARFSPASSKA